MSVSNPIVRPEDPRLRHAPTATGFAEIVLLGLIGGLHRTTRRGYGYSSKGSGWTIDWSNVFLFWLSLLLSSSSRGSGGEGSSSGGGFRGGGGSFGGGGAGSSW